MGGGCNDWNNIYFTQLHLTFLRWLMSMNAQVIFKLHVHIYVYIWFTIIVIIEYHLIPQGIVIHSNNWTIAMLIPQYLPTEESWRIYNASSQLFDNHQ